jgi:DNA-binding MarR family transcriptional regulator
MFMSDMSIIVRSGHVFASRLLKKYDISGGEQPILMYLAGNSNVNQDSISKYFMVDKGSIAKSLAKLEEKGFVQRETNRENQREKFISLTEKGQESIDHMGKFLDTWDNLLFKGISEEDKQLLGKIINKIANNAVEALGTTDSKQY